MSEHATQLYVSNLATILRDTAIDLTGNLTHIASLTYSITTPELLDATFSGLASRLDNISAMADQFASLRAKLEEALTTPAPTT